MFAYENFIFWSIYWSNKFMQLPGLRFKVTVSLFICIRWSESSPKMQESRRQWNWGCCWMIFKTRIIPSLCLMLYFYPWMKQKKNILTIFSGCSTNNKQPYLMHVYFQGSLYTICRLAHLNDLPSLFVIGWTLLLSGEKQK